MLETENEEEGEEDEEDEEDGEEGVLFAVLIVAPHPEQNRAFPEREAPHLSGNNII